MKPYFSESGLTIYCGKAEEIAPSLPRKHFSVLVLDTPFTFQAASAQEILAPFDDYLADAAAVLILGLAKDGVPTQPRFGHPHVRDLQDMKDILAKTNGAILDPYMGTGSTLMAAKELGRECAGIEIEKRWCEVAVKRLQNQFRGLSKPRICVDFDGTIFDGQGILPGCIEKLTELQKSYTIAIFSARPTPEERRQMGVILLTRGVPYDEILPPKPEADFYLDDKGRQFQGWDKVTL